MEKRRCIKRHTMGAQRVRACCFAAAPTWTNGTTMGRRPCTGLRTEVARRSQRYCSRLARTARLETGCGIATNWSGLLILATNLPRLNAWKKPNNRECGFMVERRRIARRTSSAAKTRPRCARCCAPRLPPESARRGRRPSTPRLPLASRYRCNCAVSSPCCALPACAHAPRGTRPRASASISPQEAYHASLERQSYAAPAQQQELASELQALSLGQQQQHQQQQANEQQQYDPYAEQREQKRQEPSSQRPTDTVLSSSAGANSSYGPASGAPLASRSVLRRPGEPFQNPDYEARGLTQAVQHFLRRLLLRRCASTCVARRLLMRLGLRRLASPAAAGAEHRVAI